MTEPSRKRRRQQESQSSAETPGEVVSKTRKNLRRLRHKCDNFLSKTGKSEDDVKARHQKWPIDEDEGVLMLAGECLCVATEDIEREKIGLASAKQQIHELTTEKSTLLNRLSKIAGARLTQNNPAIADLSDPNRPEKLAQQFAELYDNEWTDAFEEMTSKLKMSENDSIARLLTMLQECYKFCIEASRKQMKKLKKALLPKKEAKDTGDTEMEYLKQMTDLRKSLATRKVTDIEKNFMKTSFYEDFEEAIRDVIRPYIMSCTRICWLMCVQEPPVAMACTVEREKGFDTNRFRHYTRTGSKYDYVVWPALELYKDGPLLGKGVAQALKEK